MTSIAALAERRGSEYSFIGSSVSAYVYDVGISSDRAVLDAL